MSNSGRQSGDADHRSAGYHAHAVWFIAANCLSGIGFGGCRWAQQMKEAYTKAAVALARAFLIEPAAEARSNGS